MSALASGTSAACAMAFDIVSPAHCRQLYSTRRSPNPAQALPTTSAAWQQMYNGQLPAAITPWWMDVQFDATQATSYLWVAPDLPCFSGHFPGQPILPGVMQLDWGVALANSLWPDQTPATHFSGMARVKFKAPVMPDGVLNLILTKPERDTKKNGQRLTMTLRSSVEELTSARLLYRD